MTDTTTWAIERQKAYELFGGSSPYDKDDTAIAEAFALHPAAVLAEIARIAQAYDQGKIHTPWRALVSRLPKIEADQQTVSISGDLRVRLAETWIRNAGLYCPNDAEILDELFSSRGLLAGQEAAFDKRMLELYHHELWRAVQANVDLVARAEKWKQGQEALARGKDKPPATIPVEEPDNLATVPEDAGPPDDDWAEG